MPALSTVPLTPPELRAHLKLSELDAYTPASDHIPSRYAMVRSILSVYRSADAETILCGDCWYPHAYDLLESLGQVFGVSTDRVVGIFAHTSAGTDLVGNLRSTIGILRGEREGLPTYGKQVAKAVEVLEHGPANLSLDVGNTLDRSRKVKNFYANLMGDRNRVTVDRHALSVAGVEGGRADGGAYLAVERAYRQAARIESVTPRVMQATTWSAWRSGGGGLDAFTEAVTEVRNNIKIGA